MRDEEGNLEEDQKIIWDLTEESFQCQYKNFSLYPVGHKQFFIFPHMWQIILFPLCMEACSVSSHMTLPSFRSLLRWSSEELP